MSKPRRSGIKLYGNDEYRYCLIEYREIRVSCNQVLPFRAAKHNARCHALERSSYSTVKRMAPNSRFSSYPKVTCENLAESVTYSIQTHSEFDYPESWVELVVRMWLSRHV